MKKGDRYKKQGVVGLNSDGHKIYYVREERGIKWFAKRKKRRKMQSDSRKANRSHA